ncbi:MAG: LON peptidase substrate-binding domain-containing protein [Hyphomicrobiaceae bacterium]
MTRLAQYRTTSDLPAELPVFPLRGTILLPRATLPLNVFEPRYLAMLDHVISGSRVLGIIQPRATDQAEESPQDESTPLKSVGCAGRVTSYQELDDGRLVISISGVARFRTTTETTAITPFRLFAADYSDFAQDLQPLDEDDGVDRPKFLEVLRNYLDAKQLNADWQAIEKAPTELLINSLSVISPFGPEEKQALLEARDLKQRAEVLATLAMMDLASDDRAGGGVQ